MLLLCISLSALSPLTVVFSYFKTHLGKMIEVLSASFYGSLNSLFLVSFEADAFDEVAPGIPVKPPWMLEYWNSNFKKYRCVYYSSCFSKCYEENYLFL